MEPYSVLGIVTHFAVNFLLLMAVNWGLRYFYGGIRCVLAAVFAGIYALLCMLPQFAFLNSGFLRFTSLCVICLIAFGWRKTSVKRGLLFCLLRFALEGIGSHRIVWTVVLGVACIYVFRTESNARGYIPVTLAHQGKNIKLKALYDTGHDLRDPVTGRHVLVVDSSVAVRLTGLTTEQLSDPIQTVQEKSGYCLLPYHTVGCPNGMLLAINVKDATIGRRHHKTMVALCAERLDPEGKFQGLIGGTV